MSWCINNEKQTSDAVKFAVKPEMMMMMCLRHAHKNTVMEVKWNLNGNWLLTASRDHLCKLFDIRNLKEELQVFRGHKKEATGRNWEMMAFYCGFWLRFVCAFFIWHCSWCLVVAVAWHPIHEGLFASGGSDGSLLFWHAGYQLLAYTYLIHSNLCY